jgi:hypothetical protein
MLSRLALLWLALGPRVYLASEGGVGTELPLPLALMLESPPAARSPSRTSARRMFAAAFLAGERPSVGSVANGTMTGGDMPMGNVASSSVSEMDGAAFGERRSTMPDQSRGSECAGRYGLRAGVAGLGRKTSDGMAWVRTVGFGSRMVERIGAGGAWIVSSAAVAVMVPAVTSDSEKIDVEIDAGWGSARANSRRSRSRRTSGDSIDALQDGSAIGCCGVKEVSLAPRVRATAAAGVEETAACEGRKEPSEGVRFGSKVLRFNSEAVDRSPG